MDTDIRWLHLTDLHVGQSAARWYWDTMEKEFLDDLKYMLDKIDGPLDLVFFTGDAVQKGAKEEHEEFNKILKKLWDLFAGYGSNPKLLAVPGNHDLFRPKFRDDLDQVEPTLLALNDWHAKREVRNAFWEKEESLYRKLIHDSLKTYQDWWKACPYRPKEIIKGMLPGEFSYVFDKCGFKLGIVGLNTTFLQLDDCKEGDLALHIQQFHQACGGKGVTWTSKNHTNFLLTHHPAAWLCPIAQKDLNQEIINKERFSAHFYGHMHESSFTALSAANTEFPYYSIQGRSMFGAKWDGQTFDRSHGYSLGVLYPNQCSFRIYPRMSIERDTGYSLERDPNCCLKDQIHTRDQPIYLKGWEDVQQSKSEGIKSPVLKRTFDKTVKDRKKKKLCQNNGSKYGCEEWEWLKDNSTMVKIPAGTFWRGSKLGEGAGNEAPLTPVELDEYYIDKYPVTNDQFRRFIEEYRENGKKYETTAVKIGGVWEANNNQWIRSPDSTWESYCNADGWGDHPVVGVSVKDALAYCRWAGKLLPTEAQWEMAARGLDSWEYPWTAKNDQIPNSSEYANFMPLPNSPSESHHRKDTIPVKNLERGQSPFGCYQMAGNVWEWCADHYDLYDRRAAKLKNPICQLENTLESGDIVYIKYNKEYVPLGEVNVFGEAPKGERLYIKRNAEWIEIGQFNYESHKYVNRGGSFRDNWFALRCAYRSGDFSDAYFHVGFRCALSSNGR